MDGVESRLEQAQHWHSHFENSAIVQVLEQCKAYIRITYGHNTYAHILYRCVLFGYTHTSSYSVLCATMRLIPPAPSYALCPIHDVRLSYDHALGQSKGLPMRHVSYLQNLLRMLHTPAHSVGMPLKTSRALLGSAARVVMAACSQDSDIAGDVTSEFVELGAVVATLPRKRVRETPSQGALRPVLVLASPDGWWSGDFPLAARCGSVSEAHALVVGLALVQWEWAAACEPSDDIEATFVQVLQRRHRAQGIHGFLRYKVVEAACLRDLVPIESDTVGAIWHSVAQQEVVITRSQLDEIRSEGETYSARVLVSTWRKQHQAAPTARALLAPALACKVADGLANVLHIVVALRRLQRKFLLVAGDPSRRQVQAFFASQPQALVVATPAPEAIRDKCVRLIHSPEVIITWLHATDLIKDIRKVHVAEHRFAQIFAKRLKKPVSEIMGDMPPISYETLRRARVRADVVAMSVHRKFLRHLGDGMRVFIFCDSSPQWRGLELFATSFDVIDADGAACPRRLAPLVSLGRTQMDAQGKLYGVLWQIWLMAGPKFEDMQRFCERVVAITCDMGTERLLAGMESQVPGLYKLLGYTGPDLRSLSKLTFPRAVHMPGWRHLWDVVIRRGLGSLVFFPAWIGEMRALVSFLRSTVIVGQMKQMMIANGAHGAAEMLSRLSLPPLATWRWRTLGSACAALEPVFDTLRAHFAPAAFKNTREPSRLRKVCVAMSCPAWRERFRFVAWFTKFLGDIMAWCGGCDCCDPGSAAASRCRSKGRRLKSAFSFAQGALKSALTEANAWSCHDFGCSLPELAEFQGCVRATVQFATEKIAYLNRVPYLLVNLDQEGVCELALRQWEACGPEGHHPLTCHFLSPGGPLRAAVDDLHRGSRQCSPALRAEIASLELIPIDDTVCESPHARAKRIMDHSRASTWSWTASTMRLSQNLQDIEDLVPVLGISLDSEWSRYKSILQVNPGQLQKNKKMSRLAFLEQVYALGHLQLPARASSPAPMLCDAPPGADALAALCDAPSVGQGRDTHGDARRVGPAHPRSDPLVKLMRQYMAAAIRPMTFVSVPMLSEEEAHAAGFFQILSVEPKMLKPPTFAEEEGEDFEHVVLLEVAVQPLERWCPMSRDPCKLGEEANVFVLEEPTKIDILRLCGVDPAKREFFQEWEVGESDIEGCVLLHSPKMLRPKMELLDADIPALVLMDKLREDGFAAGGEVVEHHLSAAKVYDSRKAWARRSYLKAVIHRSELFSAGVHSFRSSKSNAFFDYMLKFKKEPPPSMSAVALRAALQGNASDEAEVLALMDTPGGQGLFVEKPSLQALADQDDEDIAGDDVMRAAPAAEDGARELEPPPVEPVDAVIAGDQPIAAPVWPAYIEGAAVRHLSERHEGRGGHNYFMRLSVRCTNLAHGRCSRTRSVALMAAELGPRAAEFHLGAWLRAADHLPAADHRRYQPSLAEMRAYAASL